MVLYPSAPGDNRDRGLLGPEPGALLHLIRDRGPKRTELTTRCQVLPPTPIARTDERLTRRQLHHAGATVQIHCGSHWDHGLQQFTDPMGVFLEKQLLHVAYRVELFDVYDVSSPHLTNRHDPSHRACFHVFGLSSCL